MNNIVTNSVWDLWKDINAFFSVAQESRWDNYGILCSTNERIRQNTIYLKHLAKQCQRATVGV